jgi:hypothetical protein
MSDMRTGERLPAFTVELDPPPRPDGGVAAELARDSAERYGREALDVELDRQAALARIDGGRKRETEPSGSDSSGLDWPRIVPGTGLPAADRAVVGAEIPAQIENKSARKKRSRSRKNASTGSPTGPSDRAAVGPSIETGSVELEAEQ